jgi:hypothetical protein
MAYGCGSSSCSHSGGGSSSSSNKVLILLLLLVLVLVVVAAAAALSVLVSPDSKWPAYNIHQRLAISKSYNMPSQALSFYELNNAMLLFNLKFGYGLLCVESNTLPNKILLSELVMLEVTV